MEFIVNILIRLGLVNGNSFDKVIAKLTQVGSYIESLEAQEKAKEATAQKIADRAMLNAATAAEKAAAAAKLRETLPH